MFFSKNFDFFYLKNFKTRPVLFSKHQYLNLSKREKASAITSIAVFYDVINPNRFVSDVKDILSKDGIWVMEQSYLPILIKNNGYDSICHEHLTYFTLKQINYLCEKNNLRIFSSLNKRSKSTPPPPEEKALFEIIYICNICFSYFEY